MPDTITDTDLQERLKETHANVLKLQEQVADAKESLKELRDTLKALLVTESRLLTEWTTPVPCPSFDGDDEDEDELEPVPDDFGRR